MSCAVGYYLGVLLDVVAAAVALVCVGQPFDLHSPRRPGSDYALGEHLTETETHCDEGMLD